MAGSFGVLRFDPGAAGALARRALRAAAASSGTADLLRAAPAGGTDPWRADAGLASVTAASCARLLAVSSEFDLVALALRAAVVAYGTADDRAVARLAGADRPRSRPAGGDRVW